MLISPVDSVTHILNDLVSEFSQLAKFLKEQVRI